MVLDICVEGIETKTSFASSQDQQISPITGLLSCCPDSSVAASAPDVDKSTARTAERLSALTITPELGGVHVAPKVRRLQQIALQ